MKYSFLMMLLLTAFLVLPAKSGDTCSISLTCWDSSVISCSITAAPGNSTNCWVGPGDQIVCCEYDPYGTPIRDIHRFCPNRPGGGGGGPGGGGNIEI